MNCDDFALNERRMGRLRMGRLHDPCGQRQLLAGDRAVKRIAIGWALTCVAATAQPQQVSAVRLGGADDARGVSFGLVADVAIDSSARVWVLDRKARAAFVVDSLGRMIGRVGGHGRGPGEWLDPEAIDVGSDGQIYVLDGLQGRVSRFHDGSGVPLDGRDFRSIGPRAGDFCVMADRVYVLSIWRDSTPVQEFRLDGDSLLRVRGLGSTKFNRDMGPRLQLMPIFADGRLTCVARAGLLAWTARYVAELRLLSVTDGSPQRVHRITGFAETIVSFDPAQNTVFMSLPASGRADEGVAAAVGGPGIVLSIGTRTQRQTTRGEFDTFYTRTVALSSQDGTPAEAGREESGAVLGAATSRLAVCYTNDPYPTVWVVRTGGTFPSGCPEQRGD
jgi:hypothetical protein